MPSFPRVRISSLVEEVASRLLSRTAWKRAAKAAKAARAAAEAERKAETDRALQMALESPHMAPEAPEVAPEAPQVSPEAPQVTPEAPQVTPAAPQVTPAAPQVTPAAPQVTPAASGLTPPPDLVMDHMVPDNLDVFIDLFFIDCHIQLERINAGISNATNCIIKIKVFNRIMMMLAALPRCQNIPAVDNLPGIKNRRMRRELRILDALALILVTRHDVVSLAIDHGWPTGQAVVTAAYDDDIPRTGTWSLLYAANLRREVPKMSGSSASEPAASEEPPLSEPLTPETPTTAEPPSDVGNRNILEYLDHAFNREW